MRQALTRFAEVRASRLFYALQFYAHASERGQACEHCLSFYASQQSLEATIEALLRA